MLESGEQGLGGRADTAILWPDFQERPHFDFLSSWDS